MEDVYLSPTDFIALTNQTFEHAFPYIVIEGEIADFRVSKGKWLYLKLKDEQSMVNCFGVVYMMPGPLEEGMVVRVAGSPKMHNRFGFSFNAQSIVPAGEGSIKKAFELLEKQLTQEGLFEESRKRFLPYPPQKIAVVTSAEGAAIADFTKIMQERWPYCEVVVHDSLVQGQNAPEALVQAIDRANQSDADALVVTRGGGGAEDLGAFNDERVVRAIASSRLPTMVAIGHEVDESLSERAADMRASTPSNAAQLLTPNRSDELQRLAADKALVSQVLGSSIERIRTSNTQLKHQLNSSLLSIVSREKLYIKFTQDKLHLLNPDNVLRRGYGLVKGNEGIVKSVKSLNANDVVELTFYDGSRKAKVE